MPPQNETPNAQIVAWAAFGLALLGQAIGGLIWLTNLGARVTTLEVRHDTMQAQMHEIDTGGTRELGLVKDRQDDMRKRLDRLETHGAP